MSLTHEYELTRQLLIHEQEMTTAMEELCQFYNEVATIGIEKFDKNELTEKEKKIVDKTVNSFLKTESTVSNISKVVDTKVKQISQKLVTLGPIKINTSVFDTQIANACPMYNTIAKRPKLYTDIRNEFKSISTLLSDPINGLDDVLGPRLTKLIDTIEASGFVFKARSTDNIGLKYPITVRTNIFNLDKHARLQYGKTAKELGYTVDNIMQLSHSFAYAKKPGFFSSLWLELKTSFYNFRFLIDLLIGRSSDEVNRLVGIWVRSMRLSIINAMNLRVLWIQQLADMNTISRLINIINNSVTHSTEALNLYSLEPSEVVTDEKIVASPDVEVDSTHDIVIPGLEDELEEETNLLFNLRNINIEKMDGYYFAKEMKDSVKTNAYNEYLAYNRKLARMSVELFVPTKKKNEKLVQTLQNSMVLLERYQQKLSTTIPINVLKKIVVDNIPTQPSFNAHIVAYNTIQKEMKNSFKFIAEPVKYQNDLGELHGLLKTCEFLGFEAINPAGLESCKSSQFFDIKYYDKDVTNVVDAGYTALELHRMSNILRKTANEFTLADSVYSNGIAIDETDLVAAISNEYQDDDVDPVLSAQARRIRYGLITQIRSQILLDSLLTDTMIMVKMIKRIIDKTK